MNCKNCNNELLKDTKFCNKCGVVVDEGKIQEITKEDKAGWITKILVAIVLIAIFVFAYSSARWLTSSGINEVKKIFNNNQTELTAEVMQEISSEVNKTLPRMIDSEVRIDSTVGMENSLTYKYTLVNYSLSDLNEGEKLSDLIGKDFVNSVCTTPEMAIYVRNKAIINYSYYGKDGIFIEKITVNTGTDCVK